MGWSIAWLMVPVSPLLGAKIAGVGALLVLAIDRLRAGGEGKKLF